MPGEFDFILTEEGFKAHEALLSEQGVKVCPKSRETVEDLEHGGNSHVCTSGLLAHGSHEFPYHLHQGKRIRLTVDTCPIDDSRGSGKALLDAVGRAFPQPVRGFPPRPRPERRFDKGQILGTLGCWGFVAILISVGVLAVIGILSILRK